MNKFYVIERYRQEITLEYVKEHLDDGWFKCFDTYEEADEYHRKSFYDDSTHGIFYRTENDKFLQISRCLS